MYFDVYSHFRNSFCVNPYWVSVLTNSHWLNSLTRLIVLSWSALIRCQSIRWTVLVYICIVADVWARAQRLKEDMVDNCVGAYVQRQFSTDFGQLVSFAHYEALFVENARTVFRRFGLVHAGTEGVVGVAVDDMTWAQSRLGERRLLLLPTFRSNIYGQPYVINR